MCIQIKLEDGRIVDYWGVRSWNINDDGDVWVYFYEPILSDGSRVGFVRGLVISSFSAPNLSQFENDQESLNLLS